ncbi:unnamed protein product [Gadus morhua 'NCC']
MVTPYHVVSRPTAAATHSPTNFGADATSTRGGTHSRAFISRVTLRYGALRLAHSPGRRGSLSAAAASRGSECRARLQLLPPSQTCTAPSSCTLPPQPPPRWAAMLVSLGWGTGGLEVGRTGDLKVCGTGFLEDWRSGAFQAEAEKLLTGSSKRDHVTPHPIHQSSCTPLGPPESSEPFSMVPTLEGRRVCELAMYMPDAVPMQSQIR